MPIRFKRFQKEQLARAACHDGVILGWEQGLGKTVAAVAWPMIKQARRVLLVVPGGLHVQFSRAVRELFGLHVTRLPDAKTFYAHRLHLPPRERGEGEKARFFLTSYTELGYNGGDQWPDEIDDEGLRTTRGDRLRQRLLDPEFQRIRKVTARLAGQRFDPAEFFAGIGEESERIRCIWRPTLSRCIMAAEGIGGGFDCVVVDEGTKLQNATSHIGAGVLGLDPRFRLVLTGTPIKNRLPSLFWLAWWACGGHTDPTARFPYANEEGVQDAFAAQFLEKDRFLTREEEKAAESRGFTTVPEDVYRLVINSRCNGNELVIPQQLSPKEYARCKKVIEQLGGSWSRAKQAHLFPEPANLVLSRLKPRGDEKVDRGGRIEKLSARICNVHRLWKLLAPIVLRQRKDECGEDIVTKTIKPIHVLPGTAQRAVYQFHLSYPPVAARATPTRPVHRRVQIGMQLSCLRQAALCPENPDLGETIVAASAPETGRHSWTDANPKQAAVLSLIADLLDQGESVLVGSPFRPFSRALHARLIESGVASVLLDGDTSPQKRGLLAERFKAFEFSVCVAGQKAMAEGFDFGHCAHLILPSISWAYDENEQFVHRIWRLNSPRPVSVYPMVLRGTIDERLTALWAEKGDSAQLALDGRLVEERVEEVSLEMLLREAVRGFDPTAETIDEQDIEAQWHRSLKARLRLSEQRFREFHPPLLGTSVSAAEVKSAIDALRLPSPSALSVAMDRLKRAAGRS